MPRVLLLLTFLNAGVVAANPTAGRWNVSAFRRRAVGRQRYAWPILKIRPPKAWS